MKAELNSRRELLTQRDRAQVALSAALSSFAAAIGQPADEGVSNTKRDCYFRLANELVKPGLPSSELVFHQAFDELPQRLAQRAELLKQRDESWEAVEARGFNPTLIKRLNLTEIETDWTKATGAFWPLSLFRKGGVKKKLKSYMKAEGVADPDVDLPLLREHQDCQMRSQRISPGLNCRLSIRLRSRRSLKPNSFARSSTSLA